MTARLFLLSLLSFFSYLKSQTLSTVFIDTVKITVDNKIVYACSETKLKFIANNTDCRFTIYNDGLYKLNLKFNVVKSKDDVYLSFSQPEFYIKDSACFIRSSSEYDYEECSDISAETESLRNWDFNNPNMPEKFKINLYYRLCRLAPADTAGYKYNFREGLWIGIDRGVEKVTVNYKKDKKDGLATAYYNDGVTFTVNYNNGVGEGYSRESFKNYKTRNK